MSKLNLIGQKFGRLTVIGEAPKRGKHYRWHCLCDCGNSSVVSTTGLRNKHIAQCKACASKQVGLAKKTHGLRKTRIYRIYTHILWRCDNKNCANFNDYGGRGIRVCDEWRHDFKAFHDWAMSHGYRDDLTIDRIDVNGNYEPSNCRWATRKEQSSNRRNAIIVNGECLKDVCTRLGIKYKMVHYRIKTLGWSIDRALTTPKKGN